MEIQNLVTYIGTKIISATRMNLGEYNTFRGWVLPANEDSSTEGYIIKYPDGYISWSPLKTFNEAYKVITGMTFGLAIEAMKKGHRVAREGWNGKGMFCIYVPGSKNVTLNPGTPYAVALKELADENGYVEGQEILPHFDMYTINTEGRKAMLPGWLASQSDMDSSDWVILE